MSSGPRTRLYFQRYADVSDGMGGYSRVWYTLTSTMGTIWVKGGDERLTADKRTVVSTHGFVCDALPGVTLTEKDRAVDKDGNIYEIAFVANPDGSGRMLQLDLKRVE